MALDTGGWQIKRQLHASLLVTFTSQTPRRLVSASKSFIIQPTLLSLTRTQNNLSLSGWPHNAPRYHQLMPISCHCPGSKALLLLSRVFLGFGTWGCQPTLGGLLPPPLSSPPSLPFPLPHASPSLEVGPIPPLPSVPLPPLL